MVLFTPSCVGCGQESGLFLHSLSSEIGGDVRTAGAGPAIIRPGLNYAAAPLPSQTVGGRNKLGDRIDRFAAGVWGFGVLDNLRGFEIHPPSCPSAAPQPVHPEPHEQGTNSDFALRCPGFRPDRTVTTKKAPTFRHRPVSFGSASAPASSTSWNQSPRGQSFRLQPLHQLPTSYIVLDNMRFSPHAQPTQTTYYPPH